MSYMSCIESKKHWTYDIKHHLWFCEFSLPVWVTFSAIGQPPLIDWYQFILVADRGTCEQLA